MSYNLNKKSVIYTAEDLQDMTISQIKSLASGLGYSITKTKKADIIVEFLEWQGA